MLRPREQLLLPLQWGPAMADGSLDAAVQAVTGAWIADGVLAGQTLDKFGLLIRRFTRFAAGKYGEEEILGVVTDGDQSVDRVRAELRVDFLHPAPPLRNAWAAGRRRRSPFWWRPGRWGRECANCRAPDRASGEATVRARRRPRTGREV